MIDSGPHDILNPTLSAINYAPVAIYYGTNIEETNKNRLHTIAAAKGIKEYEMIIDNTDRKYVMGYKPLESS